MLMGALESGSDALIQYVFETAHVLSWLVDAPTEVSPPPRGGSVANGMSRQPLRAGSGLTAPTACGCLCYRRPSFITTVLCAFAIIPARVGGTSLLMQCSGIGPSIAFLRKVPNTRMDAGPLHPNGCATGKQRSLQS